MNNRSPGMGRKWLRALEAMRWPLALGLLGAIAALSLWSHHGNSVRALPRAGAAITALALSPDGTLAAVASADGEVEISDLRTRRSLRIANSTGPARQMDFTRVRRGDQDHVALVFATSLGEVRIVDAITGVDLLRRGELPRGIGEARYSLNEEVRTLLAVNMREDGIPSLRLVGLNSIEASTRELREGEAAPTLAIAPLDRGHLVLSLQQTITYYEDDAQIVLVENAPASSRLSAFKLDGRRLTLVVGGQAMTTLFTSQRLAWRSRQTDNACPDQHGARASDMGGVVLAGGAIVCLVAERGGDAAIWRFGTIGPARVAALAGDQVLIGTDEGDVQTADRRGRIHGRLSGHGAAITAIAVSRDGRRAVSGAANGSVQVFDLSPTGARVYANPSAVARRVRDGAQTSWAALVDRVAARADEPRVLDASTFEALGPLVGAWAEEGRCEDPNALLFFDLLSGGLGVTRLNEGRTIERIDSTTQSGASYGAATSHDGRARSYGVTEDRLTRGAPDGVRSLVRCPGNAYWIDWLQLLPQPAIDDAAVDALAARLDVEADVIRAVARVRSGGADTLAAREGIDIVYFRHLFSRQTNRAHDGGDQMISAPGFSADAASAPAERQWSRLRAAAVLDFEAALRSTSWGRYQILGLNFASQGEPNVQSFLLAIARGQRTDLEMFEAFVQSNGLADELRNKDWVNFVRRFEGPTDVVSRAGRYASAYEAFAIERDPDAFLAQLRAQSREQLTDADFAAAGARLGVRAGVLRAIMDVESRSAGFADDGRPLIIFWADIFSEASGGRYDRSNPDISQSDLDTGRIRRTQAERWRQVRQALSLDADAATRAISFGAFQLTGIDYQSAGAQTPAAMLRAGARSERAQLEQLERYLRARTLVDDARRLDWSGLASAMARPRSQQESWARLVSEAYARVNQPDDASFLDGLVAQDTAPLARADIEQSASLLGVEWQALAAILEVEAGRLGAFGADGRPVILFERHLFSRLTGGRFDASNPAVSNPTAGGYPRTQEERWTQLREAYALDADAALASASYGRYQILGNQASTMNMSVRDYVRHLANSERTQLEAFVAYVRARGLADEIQSKNWAAVARAYNGPAYETNQYDRRMAEAYERLMANPIP